jgi:ABC-type phosphate/phosphonate transport system substrate-binding protein
VTVVARAASGKVDVLQIGTSGTLGSSKEASKEKGGLESLKSFIKEETGLNNEIIRQKDWSELADKLARGELHVGAFEGYEFAWAQKEYPGLKPIAVGINTFRYPVVYVVARRDSKARDFAGLQGQALYLPDDSPLLRLFAERESEAKGKDLKEFFAKVASAETVEDGLDDVVDNVVQAAVVDRAGLEAYKRRKPGRFKQLKEVARSKPFPPAVIAYYDKKLDDDTLQRLRKGLLGADKTEKGKMTLTLYRLTGFEKIPDDFDTVLGESRKTYPPPKK